MDTLITAPEAEPLSTIEAKAHLRVDVTDDDDLIAGLIQAAREWCEQYTRRAFVTQTRELVLNRWPVGTVIKFPALPLQSVTSIKYTDEDAVEATFAASNYLVDTSWGVLKLKDSTSWPTATLQSLAAIKVRYVAGYGDDGTDVPQAIRQAMLLLIGEWYEQREAGVVRDTSLAMALLSPYRTWVIK